MTKQKLSLPGILVKMKDTPSTVKFLLFITNDSPANSMFFTSPALRKVLENAPRAGDRFAGSFYYDKQGSQCGEWIYPLLYGKGIASGLERIVTRELRKVIGKNVRIFPQHLADSQRAAQQQKRGIKVKEVVQGEYDYDVSLDDLRRRINEARNKYRKIHRLPSADALVKHMQRTGGKR